jgi:hypothetical protein
MVPFEKTINERGYSLLAPADLNAQQRCAAGRDRSNNRGAARASNSEILGLKRNEKASARARGCAGASIFGMATQQNTYATRHPGYGLFRLRLRPRQQSGR